MTIIKIIGAKCGFCFYPLEDMTRSRGLWNLVTCYNCGKSFDVPHYIELGGMKINTDDKFEELEN